MNQIMKRERVPQAIAGRHLGFALQCIAEGVEAPPGYEHSCDFEAGLYLTPPSLNITPAPITTPNLSRKRPDDREAFGAGRSLPTGDLDL